MLLGYFVNVILFAKLDLPYTKSIKGSFSKTPFLFPATFARPFT
jgi:hypothetical protein